MEIDIAAMLSIKSESQIGRGASSRVFMGEIQEGNVNGLTPQLVAVKVSQDGHAALFDREIEAMNWLPRPHVTHLICFCRHEDKRYIVTPYIGGGSLATAYYARLTWETILKIADGIADGIQFFHDDNRVIGDLKPQNVLLKEDLTPVLCDFGSLAPINSNLMPNVYTPSYRDPLADITGPAQTDYDMYAFGMILLQLLMKRPVELRGEKIDIVAKRLYEQRGHVVHEDLLRGGCRRRLAVAVSTLALSLVVEPGQLQSTLGIEPPQPDNLRVRPDIESVRQQLQTLRASWILKLNGCCR